MKPLVIYHADCTDGYGAAFAAWLKLGDEAEYLPMNYNTIKEPANLVGMFGDTFAEREVYILDFSLPREAMDWLFSKAKRVVWLDHHKTAFEMWNAAEWQNQPNGYFCKVYGDKHYIHLHPTKSGALLAWEYFHPGTEVPMLIQHIDDRDRWQWKMEGSAELHAALGAMQPWSFEQWMQFVPYFDDTRPYIDLKTEGTAILRAQKQHVERMAKQARKCSIPARREVPPNPNTGEGKPYSDWRYVSDDVGSWWFATGLAVNASIHQSEVGHELANQSGTYGLVWYLGSDGRARCSLRSNGEYDVSAIARAFGGGGHRNAAGFETDIKTLMGWLHV